MRKGTKKNRIGDEIKLLHTNYILQMIISNPSILSSVEGKFSFNCYSFLAPLNGDI